MSIQGFDSIAATIAAPFQFTVGNGGERPHDFPSGLQLIEYVEGVAQMDTAFRFVGNAMPFQPFEWSGMQKLAKQYYPGNPEPSVQVLGSQEGTITLKGRWKDKRFKDPSFYGVAYQYNTAINEMRKRGNLVKIAMHGMAGNFVRWGFIEKGSFKMNTLAHIDYEIELFIVGETQPKNNFFAAPEKQSPVAVNQNLIDEANNFAQNYSTVPSTMPKTIADEINGLISTVATAVNLVTGFITDTLAVAQSVQDSANRAIGLVKNAQAQISIFNRTIDKLTHNWNTLSSQGSAAGQTRDTLANLAYIMETQAGTGLTQTYLKQIATQLETIARTVPKARYRVVSGDTLQNISVKFYGTASHWDAIYDHNQLTSTALVSGTILEIPNL